MRGICRLQSFEADQRHFQISGTAQQNHHLHHFAIGHALVGAQKQTLLAIHLRCRIKRRGELSRGDQIVAKRQRQIRLDGKEQWLIGPRLRFGIGDGQLHSDVHG